MRPILWPKTSEINAEHAACCKVFDDISLATCSTSCTAQFFWRLEVFHSTSHAPFQHGVRPAVNTACIVYLHVSWFLHHHWQNNKHQQSLRHIKQVTLSSGSDSSVNSAGTHSRYLVHGAGSDMAMKKQLVRIVNIMNRLNNVKRG